MKSFRNRRHVHFSAADMFALVRDVKSYPKFVPLCEGMRVRKRAVAGEGVEVIVAEMEVGFKAICERFASRVTCNSIRHEILVEYIDGPFKKLENDWSSATRRRGRAARRARPSIFSSNMNSRASRSAC